MSNVHEGKPGQELREGTWRQELKPSPQKNAAHWLAHPDFLHDPELTAQSATVHNGLGSHTAVINQENAP